MGGLRPRIIAGAIAVAIGAVCAGSVSAAAGAVQPATESSSFPVSRLELRYAPGVADMDGARSLRDLLYDEIELAQADGVFDAPGAGGAVRRIRVFEMATRGGARLTPAGFASLLSQLETSARAGGLRDAVVRLEPGQFALEDGVWVDRRRGGERLRLTIGMPEPEVPEADEVPVEAGAADVPADGPPLPPLVPRASDGPAFELTKIELNYVRDHPEHPALEGLLDAELVVTPTADGWVAPRGYGPVLTMPLSGVGSDGPVTMYGSALVGVVEAVARRLGEEGLIGVYVAPSADSIMQDAGGLRDVREGRTGPIVFDVYTSIVTRVGTSATGDRVPLEARIDNPVHARIRKLSPLQPYAPEPASVAQGAPGADPMPAGEVDTVAPEADETDLGAGEAGSLVAGLRDVANGAVDDDRRDLLREDVLNAFAHRLNRHPGRRVDVAVAPGENSFEAELQYIVREDRPWTLFAQLSNTGTESTGEFRQRFGAVHNQLTNADDILALDYTTSSFDEANAVLASYDRPFLGSEYLRWNVQGGWNEFDASDVGVQGDRFSGESWFWSAEMVLTAYQHDELFIDVLAGVRYQWIQVTNFVGGSTTVGEEAIFLPRVGVRASRLGDWSSLFGQVIFEWSQNDVSAGDALGFQDLGRLNPAEDWETLSWDLRASTYLEPLFNGDAWNDPSTPESSTLAHEIAVRFNGQYAFNNRLIPNAEGVIGGLFTVRGYPESQIAGDTVYSGSVEYRYHVPRAFAIDPNPGTVFGRRFRAAPQQVYGVPDWDLVLKGFVDYGRSYISQPLSFEREEALVSTGVGLELQLYDNLNFRADWGFALDEISDPNGDGVDVGDSRVHLLLTLVY